MHLKGTFGPEFAFGHAGKLTQRPLCQAEETFAWWEGKQMRGNGAVPWGLRRLIRYNQQRLKKLGSWLQLRVNAVDKVPLLKFMFKLC